MNNFKHFYLTEVDNRRVNIATTFKTADELRKFMKDKIVRIEFKKLENGKLRMGFFTLDMKRIPRRLHPNGNGPGYDRIRQIRFFDMKLKAWRSANFFNIESVRTTYWVPPKPIKKTDPTKPIVTPTTIKPKETPVPKDVKIDLPVNELDDLQNKINIDQLAFTTKQGADRGKYKPGMSYLAPWGSKVRINKATLYKTLEEHPYFSQLTDQQKAMLGDKPGEVLELKRV